MAQTTSQVNRLYQKYFGRNANTNEIKFWKTQSSLQLETQLKNDYKNTSGINYDGSPIKPGQTKSENQLKAQPEMATLYGPNNEPKVVEVGSQEASDLQSQGWGLTEGSYKPVRIEPTEEQKRPTEDKTIEYDPYEEAAKYGYSREDFANDPGFYNYWKNKTPEQLKAELTRRGDYDIKSGTKVKDDQQIVDEGLTDAQKTAQSEGHNWIDGMLKDGSVSEGQALILHEIFSGDYTSGQKIPSTQELQGIIAQAATNAEIDLAPYYEKMEYRDIQDIKQSLADIRSEAARETTREQVDYKQQLAQTQQSLRQRGLTFSGVSRAKLGAEGALEAAGVEGELPGARRLGYEERTAGYQQRARDIGTAAERKWGTGVMTGLDEFGQPIDDQSWLAPYGQQPAQLRPQVRPEQMWSGPVQQYKPQQPRMTDQKKRPQVRPEQMWSGPVQQYKPQQPRMTDQKKRPQVGAFGSVWTPQGQKSLREPWLKPWQQAGERRYEIGDEPLAKKKAIEESKWNRVSKFKSYI